MLYFLNIMTFVWGRVLKWIKTTHCITLNVASLLFNYIVCTCKRK